MSPFGGAALGIIGGSMVARRLCRAVTGVPAAPCYGWTMAVIGVSKTNGPERFMIGVGGFAVNFARDYSRRRLSKIIKRLKFETGRGGRKKSF